MKAFIAFFCAWCAANCVVADPYSAAIRQAKDVSARVTQAEGGNSPAPARSPASPQAPPANPEFQATLQNIANLRSDFAALGNLTGTNSIATPRQMLLNDLATAARGTNASPASVSRLADDLAAASAGKLKSSASRQKLAQDIHAIFNSSQLSPVQQQMIFDSVQTILQGIGVSAEATAQVINDIKQIAAETR